MYRMKPTEEHPIFRRSELNYSTGSGVTHLTITNNYVTMVVVGGRLHRFSTSNPRQFERKYGLFSVKIVNASQ